MNLESLKRIAEKLGKTIEVYKEYHTNDYYDIKYFGKPESDCKPTRYYYGLEVKPWIYLWYVSFDDAETNSESHLMFNHFYNMNTGKSQKSYKRMIAFELKHDDLIIKN